MNIFRWAPWQQIEIIIIIYYIDSDHLSLCRPDSIVYTESSLHFCYLHDCIAYQDNGSSNLHVYLLKSKPF